MPRGYRRFPFAAAVSTTSLVQVSSSHPTHLHPLTPADVEHKPRVVLRDQPAREAPPSAEPLWTNETSYEKPWDGESSRGRRRPSSSWSRATSGTPWFSKSSSATTRRRPKISHPSNFRHLHSESFQFPPAEPALPQPVEKRSSFHPLELSYQSREHTFSPLLDFFSAVVVDDDPVTPPPKAHTSPTRWDRQHPRPTLRHERSYSPMSFHIPRKHLRDNSFGSSSASPATPPPPSIPTKSRARAHTSPSSPPVDALVERIASAMIVKDRLDAEIESIIERQSLYISSRPSTAYGPGKPPPLPPPPPSPQTIHPNPPARRRPNPLPHALHPRPPRHQRPLLRRAPLLRHPHPGGGADPRPLGAQQQHHVPAAGGADARADAQGGCAGVASLSPPPPSPCGGAAADYPAPTAAAGAEEDDDGGAGASAGAAAAACVEAAVEEEEVVFREEGESVVVSCGGGGGGGGWGECDECAETGEGRGGVLSICFF